MKFRCVLIFLMLIIPIFTWNANAQEPTTHTIKITNSKYTPSTLEIEIGDIVIFEMAEDAFGHNVAQTKNSKTLDYKDGGFRSGDPTSGPFTWQVPEEYLNVNVTLFYMCEPHASNGMRGKIIVGDGSEEDIGKTPGFMFLGIIVSLSAIILIRKNRI